MPSVFARRVGAYLADIAILFSVLAPLGGVVQLLLGVQPTTAQGIYGTLLLNFSVPVWAYFILADRSDKGATVGKRLLKLRTEAIPSGRVGSGTAFARTAVKMLPWEMTHASMFLFAPALGEYVVANWMGLGIAYVLSFLYLGLAWRTRGRQSLHDRIAGTQVVASMHLR